MKKIAVLIVAFICIFGLSGCVPAPGSSGPGRPIAAYIADDVTKAEITHRSGGTAEELRSYMQTHCQKKFLHYKV